MTSHCQEDSVPCSRSVPRLSCSAAVSNRFFFSLFPAKRKHKLSVLQRDVAVTRSRAAGPRRRPQRKLRGDARSCQREARRPFRWLHWRTGQAWGAPRPRPRPRPAREGQALSLAGTPPSLPGPRRRAAFLVIICYFTFLGKGHENRISLSRPRDMHTSWSLRMDPTWLSSLPRVLGPPGPGSCSPTVRSRGAPEGQTGRPRHQHPRRPSQRRPSPARGCFRSRPAPPPHVTGHAPWEALPQPDLKAHLSQQACRGAVSVCGSGREPSNCLSPFPTPGPQSPPGLLPGPGAGARGHGGGADSRVTGLSMKAKSFDREFAFPVPRAEGGAAPLAPSAGRRGEPAPGPAPRR